MGKSRVDFQGFIEEYFGGQTLSSDTTRCVEVVGAGALVLPPGSGFGKLGDESASRPIGEPKRRKQA